MTPRRPTPLHLALGILAIALALPARGTAAPQEIKGAAILDHPCGKTSVKHMSLVHAGKMDEALALATAEMRQQWTAMPAEDKKMMLGMMKEMSPSDADYLAEIKAGGVLVVDGATATLTVTKETKDANGTSKEVKTQTFAISGATCLISD